MIIISHYRDKCIGCNACVEIAPEQWAMSRRDGKSVLIGAREKKGVYTVRLPDEAWEANRKAAEACPVNIIKIQKLP